MIKCENEGIEKDLANINKTKVGAIPNSRLAVKLKSLLDKKI